MFFRFVHISDTHLGYRDYYKINSHGVNQREADVMYAFKRAINEVLELRPLPGAFIHSGDLFDMPRPSNRIIRFAQEQMERISGYMPVVLIGGNHDTAKMASTGQVLSLLEPVPDIYVTFDEPMSIEINEDVCVTALPHHALHLMNIEEVSYDIFPDPDYPINILVVHGVAEGSELFSQVEATEESVSAKLMSLGWTYVALGHFHKFEKVAPNAYYAGAAENITFRDVKHKPRGFAVVDIEEDKFDINYVKIPVRPMKDFPTINADGMDALRLLDAIKKNIKKKGVGKAIVRQPIINVPPNVMQLLDFGEIKELTADAVFYKLKPITSMEQVEKRAGEFREEGIGTLMEEWDDYVKKEDVEQEIADKGRQYLKVGDAENGE